MSIRNSNNIRSAIQRIVNPSGIVKYNVVYIPKLHGYKITLVSRSGGINASYIAKVIEELENMGYTVTMSNRPTLFSRSGVVTLFVTPRSTP